MFGNVCQHIIIELQLPVLHPALQHLTAKLHKLVLFLFQFCLDAVAGF